jgi:hypothetical protein
LLILYLEFRPFKVLKLDKAEEESIPFHNLYAYNVIVHVHTQFSFDSLGKPSDIKKAMEINNIDYVFITDHNNLDYKYFEDDRVFAGIEKNTPDGRLLLLGNQLPVISHPHNFDFDHYRWKGEFRKGYLYEFIDIKDIIVWNKFFTGICLTKNLLILPISRNLIHKWNCLIPIDKWRELYFTRAKGLNIIGGLDLHVKVVYQEKTHGVLIPSYKSGFKWLINKVYSKEPLNSKEDVLKSLSSGNLFLSINQNFIDIFAIDKEGIKILGERVCKDGKIYFSFDKSKRVKILFKDGKKVFITDKKHFSYKLKEEGIYHLEVYEYDFRIFNLYFGFRPVVITNFFEVAGEK